MYSSRRRFLRHALAAGAGAALAGPPGLTRAAFAADTGSLPTNLADAMPRYVEAGAPRGVNLSFSSDELTRRTATWLTSDRDTESLVRWVKVGVTTRPEDVSPQDLQLVQRGTSERAPFGEGDPDGRDIDQNPAAFFEPHRDNGEAKDGERQVFVHRATMSGPQPGERIAYQVGGDGRWSDIFITHGGPLVDEGFRFTHFGDHGTGEGALRANRVLRDVLEPDWHMIAGDISYANGDQRLWDLWAEQFSTVGAQIPMMASPGNHEAKDFMGQAYRTRFSFLNHGSSFFSWTYGNVFLVSSPAGAFFGDVDGAMEDIRYELIWLEHTLARAAALRAAGIVDFIVCTQHFPSYTDHRTRGPVSPDRVVAAEQILQRYQIDLLLVGHDHMYQRSHPMAFGLPTTPTAWRNSLGSLAGQEPTRQERYSNSTGYIEVIAGSGGKGLYDFTEIDTFDLAYDEENPMQRTMPWLAASAREQCVVTYDVRGPQMEITGHLFRDGNNANVGDGVPGNEPGEPDGPWLRFDPELDPEPFDTFTLVRKAYAEEVPTTPRPTMEILRDVPEAHGSLVYDLAEDCTHHDH